MENEPAFPGKSATEYKNPDGGTKFKNETGMTLRDYFAAKAMQGIISSSNNSCFQHGGKDGVAYWAYKYADAMLEARKEG